MIKKKQKKSQAGDDDQPAADPRAGGYTNKVSVNMKPDQPAGRVYKKIFQRLFDILQFNEEGIRQDLDIEYLHDFRVSVRRSRSLLSRSKGVIPAEIIEYFSEELRWLGQITSPLRDNDVWLVSFDEYESSLPANEQRALEPLRSWLQQQRNKNFTIVIDELNSNRYQTIINDWQQFLSGMKLDSVGRAGHPVLEVSGREIWKTYIKLRKRGEAVNASPEPQLFHDLRKTGKKLRYMLMFFQSLYPAKNIKPALEKLEHLQEYLGTYQDYHVQQQSLAVFMDGMRESTVLSPETEQAMQHLIRNLADREARHQQDFPLFFAEFMTPKTNRLYKKLFHRS